MKTPPKLHRILASILTRGMCLLVASLGLGLGLAPGWQAAGQTTSTYTKTTDGTTQWSTPGDGWDTTPISHQDTVLTLGGGAAFGDVAQTVISNNDVADPFLLNSLTFNYAGPATGAASSVTISGGALQFMASSSLVDPTLTIAATGAIPPTLTISANVILGSTLTVAASSNATISGAISGAGALIKNGTGTLTLTVGNSYEGQTTVNAGILNIRNATSLGGTTAGTTVNAGGQLQLQGGVTVTGEALSLSGNGFAGSGATTQGALRSVNGNNTWAGDISIDSAGTNMTRILSNSGSTLTLSGTITTNGAAVNGFVFQGDGAINVTGNITGDANITKSTSGAGRVILSGTNSSTLGIFTVSNGTIQFARRVSLYNADQSEWTTPNLQVGSAGTLAFNVGGVDEFTAADIDILKGVGFAANANLGLDTTNAAGGVFTYSSVIGDVGANALALTKLGTNTLALTAANTFSGRVLVTAGTLDITNNTALGNTTSGTTVNNGTTLRLIGGLTITGETLSLTGGGVGDVGALRVSGGSTTWTGNISASTTTITRIATETAADSLLISGNIATSTSGTQNASGLVFQGNGQITVSGNITGLGAITRSSSGNGLLLLTGTNTYAGATAVSAGTLQVGQGGIGSIAGTVVNITGGTLAGTGSVGSLVSLTANAGAFLAPGDSAGVDAGTLTLTGGLTLAPGSKVKFDLGTNSDLILLTGGTFTGNASGLTTFQFTTGAGFANGTYNLFDWSALAVTTTGVDLTDFAYTGLTPDKSGSFFNFDSTGRILQITIVPEPSRALLLLAGLMGLVMRRRR